MIRQRFEVNVIAFKGDGLIALGAKNAQIFIPLNEISPFMKQKEKLIKEAIALVGKKIWVEEIAPKEFSRKALLKEFYNTISIGDIFTAKVTSIKNGYGVFVSLGKYGYPSFIPLRELSTTLYSNIHNWISVKQILRVRVKLKENGFITLSRKDAYSLEEVQTGNVVIVKISGKVNSNDDTDDGFFFELNPADNGIVNAPGRDLKEGETVIVNIRSRSRNGLKANIANIANI